MINRKRLFVSATFLSLAVFLITGCQQQGSGIKKIKDITVSKEDQEAIDERVKDLKQIEEDRIGSVDFGGGVVISLQVPEGWDADSYPSDVNKEYSNISAYHFDYPVYDLTVEIDDAEDKNYKELSDKYAKKINTLSADNIGSIQKEFEKSYETYLKKQAYPKWSCVSFGNTTINGQYYITVMGKEKKKDKKHEGKGMYRYVTFYKGKMFKFEFTAKNPQIDDAVTAIFDSIMQTVTYEKQAS